tara:strand:- start:233 stop:433 length:201 start_codon:yes stop_codon:yes gene_type:complete
MKVGDLVKLKGFKNSNQNEIPHGLITAELGLNKFKVEWLNKNVALRWALTSVVAFDKLELINSNTC